MAKRYNSTLLQRLLRNRVFQLGTVFFIISYFLLILSSINVIDLNKYKITYKSAIYIITFLFVVIGMSIAMFTYLQGTNSLKTEVNRKIDNIELQTQLKKLEILIEQQRHELLLHLENTNSGREDELLSSIKINPDDISIEELRQKIKNVINDDFITGINENISKKIVTERGESITEIMYFGNNIADRLRGEIEKLDRKSNINLIIGSLTTMVAFIGLAIVVFGQSNINHDIQSILYHYIPRISFIVFIEVFAFFFLRLYKLNLNDIKYYQNELTNIEIKILSIMSSVKFGVKEDISSIVVELSKTERNFILEKGQTTIEFEKFKFENNSIDKFTKLLKNVLPKLK